MKPRFIYFILALLTIVLGIASRKIVGIPLLMGDILYAVLVYFGFRWLLVKSKAPWQIGLPLLFCFAIEIQQLSTAAALVFVQRKNIDARMAFFPIDVKFIRRPIDSHSAIYMDGMT